MLTAQDIITRCGGHKAVAEWLGIARSTVQRWTYESPKGSGGSIPARNWALLIAAARVHGIEITPDELVPAAAVEAARLPIRKNRAA